MIDAAAVRQALGSVLDPELGLDIVALGLVYNFILEPDKVTVTMTMTSAACPMHAHLTRLAQDAVLAAGEPGLTVDVNVVFDPPWTPTMMSAEAKRILGY